MLSRVAKIFQLPAVTAYLITGVLLGPFLLGRIGVGGLGFTSLENVESFGIISDVALGFIAFSIGNEFRVAQLKKIGSSARRAMEHAFDRKVFLELWVRVRESWSDDAAALKQFGYSE
jgi:Kef-type K+ transport system membrane component KefB